MIGNEYKHVYKHQTVMHCVGGCSELAQCKNSRSHDPTTHTRKVSLVLRLVDILEEEADILNSDDRVAQAPDKLRQNLEQCDLDSLGRRMLGGAQDTRTFQYCVFARMCGQMR